MPRESDAEWQEDQEMGTRTQLTEPPPSPFTSVPVYIEERIRRPIPQDCFIVPCSTPVVSFGDMTRASVATLGLNPSRLEFLDSGGSELTGSSRRFETLTSLPAARLSEATPFALERVLQACSCYFERNPYRRWFDQLEPILAGIDASYYDGSACHLDLVQWATDPTWGKLPRRAKNQLLAADAGFLGEQLRRESIRLLLLNGRGVLDGFERAFGIELKPDAPPLSDGEISCSFRVGTFEQVRVIAWSTNIQSSFGVSRKLRGLIASRVARLGRPVARRPIPPSRRSDSRA
jgi:hypothetical protein